MINEKNYDDIIDLPHHKSVARKHMPLADRAAQFAPFAALTGYDAAVRETARLTDRKVELDEYEKEKINSTLQYISNCIGDMSEVEMIYFVPDERKSGGAYVTKIGAIKKIAEFERTVVFNDGTDVAIDNILSINVV